MTLFDTFDAVRIINLPERTDRRSEMTAELRRIGIDVSQDPKVRFFQAVRPADPGAFPSIGARGCFLSHLNLLRQAAAENLDSLFILEDDAHFPRRFDVLSRPVAQALVSPDWDIFYAGYGAQTPVPPAQGLQPVSPDLPLSLTHAMGLRKTAIGPLVDYLERMLERPAGSPEGGPMHVDGAYSWFRQAHPGIRTGVAAPVLITQRSSASDIAGRERWYQGLPLVNLLRKLKNL